MRRSLFAGATPPHADTPARVLGISAAFIVAYVVVALLARHYLVRPFGITAWYPAAGLALGLLLVYGVRYWPALAVASTINLMIARGTPVSYLQFLAPVIITGGYAGMAALLLGPFGFRKEFDRVRDIWLLVAVSAVGTLLMGFAYPAVFRIDTAIAVVDFERFVFRFWIGHLVGIVINTPLLLLLVNGSLLASASASASASALGRRRRLELAAQLATALFTLAVIFGPGWNDAYKLFYLLFLPLIWIAARQGIGGAVLGLAVIQVGLIAAILNSSYQSNTVVTEFQFMMLALAVTGLFLGMFVAERRAAHDALDSSESRLRAIFSTASYGIITVDERDAIVTANPAACAVFCAGPDGLAGMAMHAFIPDFVQATRIDEAVETDGIKADGAKFPLELAVRSTTSGHPALHIAIVRDITRRRELEEQVAAAQAELNRSARLAAAGEMAAALAHELHQPLSAILNYASALQLVDAASAAPALMREVEREAVRAAQIVQRLRNYFQEGTVRLEKVNVRELIKMSLAHAREEAVKSRVSLEMNVTQEAELLVDRVQIETVLHCLIGNAIDSIAARADGKREVCVEAAASRTGWVDFSVIDSGRGISPVMLGRLFEPFATNKDTGIGLGLSVSRSLVEAHGGRLWAEPRAAGAAFHFSLPTPEVETAGTYAS